MGTAAARSSASTDYYKRGQYIPGLTVNGMDILVAKAAVQHGRKYALDGYGPLVLEYVTYVCNHPKSLLLFSDAKIRDMAGIV
jgi:pyruvate dehydrogenase E1 component alpha subunit